MTERTLSIGDPAPDADLPVAGGGRVRISALRGKAAVVYFYPKDDTSGCTQEAISFSEKTDDFAALGAVVVGISRDDIDSHERFAAKHNLTVMLASDPDGAACEAYGVWVEKNMYGRKYMGIERATFLIDRTGRISQIWRKVKVPGHADTVLSAARSLPPAS